MHGDKVMKVQLKMYIKIVFAIILICSCSFASAAMCTVGTQSINFGSYDVFTNSNVDSTGNISVSCDSTASYTISLSSGGGNFLNRALNFGNYLLYYNLFIDAARTIVWGDGSNGTSTVSGITSTTAHHIVYGRIPARQNAFVGNYTDNVNVTISF